MNATLPMGFRVVLDADVAETGPGLFERRGAAQRLTEGGRAAWTRLAEDGVCDDVTGRLARRLTDAGFAHPLPPESDAPLDVTIVVPVRDRADALDSCLTALGGRYPVIVVDDASIDAASVAAAAHRHGALLVRLDVNVGPGGARNAGLAHAATGLVAFVDSDTVPDGEWLAMLAPHFADPMVGAVAPRVRPVESAVPGVTGLDLGPRPARVRPYGAVSFVPTAALLARRAALVDVARDGNAFDPALRYGEDVDLAWRLDAAGWRVRYEPAATVAHAEPRGLPALLARRFRYGTSAAPLARRHPESLAPLEIHPPSAVSVLALLAGRPVAAAAALAVGTVRARRRRRGLGLPAGGATTLSADAAVATWVGAGRYVTQFALPAAAALLVTGRPRRRLAFAALLLSPPVAAWRGSGQPRTAPVRFGAAHVADAVAYGMGVVTGCIRERNVRPLIPRPLRRSR